MNGVRRFLGSGISISNSPPLTPSDGPSATITGKPSWPPSPVQSRSDLTEGAKPLNQGQSSRKDRQRSSQATEDSPITMPLQGSRVANNTSVVASRSQPSISTPSGHTFRSSSPLSGASSSRALSQSHQSARTSVNSINPETPMFRLLNARDELLVSLLASEAVVDSRECEMLSAEEVDDLKKELQVLDSRLEAMTKKLVLETKIRDAAVSLSKINSSHKKISKQSEEQLESANRRVDSAQKELWRVSQRQNEVHKRLLEHRAGVLSYSLRSMEKKMANEDTNDTDLSSPFHTPTTSSMTSVSAHSISRFDGAHLFAGHADAQIPSPRRIPGVAEMNALEDRLKAATDALNDANKKQAEMARELSHLRLEKQEVETVLGMDLQSAEETILALEKELPRIETLDAQLKDMLQQKAIWENDRALLTERTRQFEAIERQLEQQKGNDFSIAEAKERHRMDVERKDGEIRELKQQLTTERQNWERERAVWEDEKLEDLTRLQDEVDALRREDHLTVEKAHSEVEEALASLQTLIQQHDIVFFSRDYSLQGLLSSVATHLEGVSTKIASHDKTKDEWEALRRKLEGDIRIGLDKRETLSRELEDARREREDARRDLRLMESRLKDQPNLPDTTRFMPATPSSELPTEVKDYIPALQSLWTVLPSPEARAAKFGNQRQFRTGTPTSPTPSSPKPGSTSLSELDVRSLKLLYETRATPPSQSVFSLDAFIARVQALIADDRALIERLIRFAQAHDLLKKNAERAQKLAQESNTALETYQKQVRTLEERNMTLASKQIELQDEVQALQRAVDLISAQKREVERQAAEQAETCRQLSDANNQLSAKALILAEEAASAPEKIRKLLEGQLSECQASLERAQDEIDMLRTSEQSQRIALLDELNLMQTENGNLRAQLRAVKK